MDSRNNQIEAIVCSGFATLQMLISGGSIVEPSVPVVALPTVDDGDIMPSTMLWAADCPMLAAMQETRFTIWYYPAIIYVDKALLGQTLVERDTAEFGKHPVITSFLKSLILSVLIFQVG